MNTLVLVLSYIILLLVVAVGYLLWNNRNLNRVANSTPAEISELWKRTREIHDVKHEIDKLEYNIDQVEHSVKELELKVFPSRYPPVEEGKMYLRTNPEDSHAAE